MSKSGREKRARQCAPKEQLKSLKDAYHLNDKYFKWTFKDCHWNHSGWLACKDLKFFAEHIIDKLQSYEQQTWQEILNASGGKAEGKGNNSHFIIGSQLPRDEKSLFIKSGYMEKYEKVFSLRLTGKERLIGFVDLNVFHVLWFDAEHKIF